MSTPTHPSSDEIFAAALAIDDPARRTAYLDEICTDEKVRADVEGLLKHYIRAESFLESPVVERPDLATALFGSGEETNESAAALDIFEPSQQPGSLGRMGKYEILEVVGRGGMGIVLKAQDTKLHRIVAVKVLAPELAANPTARKRFAREAQAAAAISHDHVVTIYAVEDKVDAGNAKLPYLVMEFIDGQSLEEKINREGHLKLKEILRIGRQIALGLAAAHEQGLIHRDVKPANILLQNSVQRVQITDFGLARAVDDVSMTRTGEVTGTPQYMSPEQAEGHPLDPRSDLFSLGSVLYIMCTGRGPFRADSTVAALRRVCDDTPRPIREINPDIPIWLVNVIDSLLEKNPEDRIQSAEEVSDLLAKCLAQLNKVGSNSVTEIVVLRKKPRAKKTSARQSSRRVWLVPVMSLLAIGLLFSVTEATGVTHVASTVIRLATGEGTLVIEVDDPTIQVSLDGEELSISGAGFQELKLRAGKYRFQATKDGEPVKTELVSIERGGRRVVKVGLESPHSASQTRVEAAEYRSIPDGAICEVRRLSRVGNAFINSLVFTRDGRHLICAGAQPEVWDMKSGSVVRLPKLNGAGCTSLAISPDAKSLATGYFEHGTLALWDLEARTKIREFVRHSPRVRCVTFSPDGRFLLSTSTEDDTARLWNVETAEQIWQFDCEKYPAAAAFSPNGDTALVSDAHLLHMIDVNSGEEVWQTDKAETVHCADFSPNGSYLVSGAGNGTLQLWNAETGEEIHQFYGHRAYVRSVQFLPDGRHLISGSEDKTLRIWNVETRSEVARIEADKHFVNELAVSPDGHYVATGGGHFSPENGRYDRDGDYDIHLWRLPESVWPKGEAASETADAITELRRFTEFDEIWSVAITPDSRYVLCTGEKEVTNPLVRAAARVWDRGTGRLIHTWRPTAIWTVAVSPDSRTAALGAYDGRVFLYDIESGEERGVLEGHSDIVRSVAFSENGGFLVSGSIDGTARLWNLAERRETQVFQVGKGKAVHCVRLSADGGRVLTSSYGVGVNLWDATTGEKLLQLVGPRTSINRVDLSADGRFVAFQYHRTAPEHKMEIAVLDIESGEVVQRLKGHLAEINELLFLPDGRRILSGGLDKTLRLWDWRSGQQLSKIELPNHIPLWLAVSGDGRYAVSGSDAAVYEELQSATDRTVRLWRLPPRVPLKEIGTTEEN